MTKSPVIRILLSLTILTLTGIGLLYSKKILNAEGAQNLILSPAAYGDGGLDTVWEQLQYRVQTQPFNLVAAALFGLAICHTFFAHQFTKLSKTLADRHKASIRKEIKRHGDASNPFHEDLEKSVSFAAEITHFLGEVEIIFFIWVVPLVACMIAFYGWDQTVSYMDSRNYIEPLFVVVIMTLAATRPILRFAEAGLASLAKLGGDSIAAWWIVLLTVGPILGSFVTEPAAMTICALLLSRKFYAHGPSQAFSYATLGLLFVNISVGGTLTHFAAPPVLMVAIPWQWTTGFMIANFGWKAALGILSATGLYFIRFKNEFHAMEKKRSRDKQTGTARVKGRPVPAWITIMHLLLLAWTVFNSHHPAIFIGSFIFFLGFYQATAPHQSYMTLKSPILVGSFLAGLVIHGGLQGWWIAPILGSLSDWILMKIAIVLTAFNDNAAITYLTTLIPDLGPTAKYAVLAGAVTGGGLTVIANAPNPAGQSLLKKHFESGVSPLRLALSALLPTLILYCAFRFLP